MGSRSQAKALSPSIDGETAKLGIWMCPSSAPCRAGRPQTLRSTAQAGDLELEMARPEGFEPPTNGFGSHYSIRLSYGRLLPILAVITPVAHW